MYVGLESTTQKHRCGICWSKAKKDWKLYLKLWGRCGSSVTMWTGQCLTKRKKSWFHIAKDDSLSENTDSNGVFCEKEQTQTSLCHWLCTKSTRWNVDITIHYCKFQQAHSSTNEIAETLFNQPNCIFTNICLCNGLDFQIKTIQESKHIKEPRRTITQRTFYCGFVCSLVWYFLSLVSDMLLRLHFFSKRNTFCESKKSSH